MAKRFLKRAFGAVAITVLIVITASLTYQYVVPMILSDEASSAVSDGIGAGEEMLYAAQDKVADIFITEEEPVSEDPQIDETDGLIQNDMYDEMPESQEEVIPYKTASGGKVTRIVDGDTLDIDGIRIRLALVNTPESGEAGYKEATAFTAKHCPVGSTAMYDVDNGQKGGSYGRVIGKVWCFGYPVQTPETSLNAMLIDAGHARVLERFCGVSQFKDDHWTGC